MNPFVPPTIRPLKMFVLSTFAMKPLVCDWACAAAILVASTLAMKPLVMLARTNPFVPPTIKPLKMLVLSTFAMNPFVTACALALATFVASSKRMKPFVPPTISPLKILVPSTLAMKPFVTACALVFATFVATEASMNPLVSPLAFVVNSGSPPRPLVIWLKVGGGLVPNTLTT